MGCKFYRMFLLCRSSIEHALAVFQYIVIHWSVHTVSILPQTHLSKFYVMMESCDDQVEIKLFICDFQMTYKICLS